MTRATPSAAQSPMSASYLPPAPASVTSKLVKTAGEELGRFELQSSSWRIARSALPTDSRSCATRYHSGKLARLHERENCGLLSYLGHWPLRCVKYEHMFDT